MSISVQHLFQSYFNKTHQALKTQDYSGFVSRLAVLGGWIQQNWQIPAYKGNEQKLENKLQEAFTASMEPMTAQDAAHLEVFKNVWQDESLARLSDVILTDNRDEARKPRTCLLVKEGDHYKIIPFEGESIKLEPENDIAEIAKKIQNSQSQSETNLLHKRLLKAVRELHLEHLDQKGLAVKTKLEKDIRHRIKLGLQAFIAFEKRAEYDEPQKIKTNDQTSLRIVSKEPTATEIKSLKPRTYIVVRPGENQAGKAFYFSEKAKKQIIKDSVLQEALKPLPKTLSIEDPQQQVSDEEIKNLVLGYHCAQLDKKAQLAISRYKTFSQKVTTIIGSILAALTAFAYGTVELLATMMGFFVVAGITWSNPLSAIGGVLLLAGAIILPIPSTWTDWKVFSTYVPGFLDNIAKEYREINSRTKKGIFWGLTLFAVATGMAAGGLAYTSAIALPAMFGLGAIGIIFPPLGVFLAVAIMFSQTFSMIRSFTNLLRKENSWNAFKKPFFQVNQILKSTNASTLRRIFTWVVVAGLTALSVLGLMMSCLTSTRSVGKFFIDQFMLAPQRALALGIMIAGVSSFCSRVYFTIDSAITAGLILCKRALKADPRKVFSQNPDHYHMLSFSENVTEENQAEMFKKILTKAAKIQKKFVVILTGKDVWNKQAYFIKNKKIVNTEKSPIKEKSRLSISVEVNQKQKDLMVNGEFFDRELAQKVIKDGEKELLQHEKKLHPITWKQIWAILINAFTAGGFYTQNVLALSHQTAKQASQDANPLHGLSSGSAGVLAAVGGLTAGTRYIAINTKHVDSPEDSYQAARKKAAEARLQQNIKFYLEKNPYPIFMESPVVSFVKKADLFIAPMPA